MGSMLGYCVLLFSISNFLTIPKQLANDDSVVEHSDFTVGGNQEISYELLVPHIVLNGTSEDAHDMDRSMSMWSS